MRNRQTGSQPQGEAIDLTPMLDVVFIMLIFFIVTASFIKLPGVEVNKVDADTAENYKKVGILVAVTPRRWQVVFLRQLYRQCRAWLPLSPVCLA